VLTKNVLALLAQLGAVLEPNGHSTSRLYRQRGNKFHVLLAPVTPVVSNTQLCPDK
jgi:hypothetical protein